MELELVLTPGLGDNSYLLASGGDAAVVDPQRDASRLLGLAESKGLTIRLVLETHVHNDYVSGAVELAAATGSQIVAPASAGYGFDVHGVREGDEVRLGELRIVALETPGHTPEHTSYLVYEGDDVPSAVFTGGSLMVGGAGRTDLLGPDRTDALTRAQFRTLRRLAALPDIVQVLPTHGAGSFCGAGPAPVERVSTMLEERRRNGALAAADEETFVRQQLSGLLAFPAYYRNMAPINRAGPRLMKDLPRPRPLSAEDVDHRLAGGSWVVDARDRQAFASAHLPGSINIELDEAFGSYVGWLLPFNVSVVLVLPEPEPDHLEVAAVQLIRIGFEQLEGYLEGGVPAWVSSGRATRSFGTATVEDLCAASGRGEPVRVLDVRQRQEWDEGHLAGSMHLFVGDLPGRLDEVPREGEVWTACRTGHRSAMAASLLERAGVTVRNVAEGGIPDVLRLCPPDDPLESGQP